MTKNDLKSAKGQEGRANGKANVPEVKNIRMPVRKKSAGQTGYLKGKNRVSDIRSADGKYRIENFRDRALSERNKIRIYRNQLKKNATTEQSTPDVPFTRPVTLPSTSLEPAMYAISVTDCTESNKMPFKRYRQYQSCAR